MTEIQHREAGAIRAFSEGEVQGLEVLAMPFNPPTRLDRLGQWVDARTDLMIEVGDRRPLIYVHGASKYGGQVKTPVAIGYAQGMRIDVDGFWMRAFPDESVLGKKVKKAAAEGRAAASSGSISHLVRPEYDRATGKPPHGSHLATWPIAELSVWDRADGFVPVSDQAIVMPLRACYRAAGIDLPEAFEADEDKNAEDIAAAKRVETKRERIMEPEIKQAVDQAVAAALEASAKAEADEAAAEEAMRAKILKDMGIEEEEAERKYVRAFNVIKRGKGPTLTKEDEEKGLTLEDKQESAEYMRGLFEAGRIVREGGTPPARYVLPDAGRAALEETEALEIGPMVPTEVAGQIKVLRGKYSLVDRTGMTRLPASRLTFSVPAETTAVTELATIAEEGAYTDLQPAFAAKTATMLKKGGYIAVTEEALEDQTLFQAYLPGAAAKALALAENEVLSVLTESVDGTEIAVTHTPSDAETIALYYGLAQEYRDGAVFIMNDAWLGYFRGLLVATPRAYGEFGFNPMSMGEAGEAFMNKPVFTNGNWADLTAADDVKIVDFVNLDECISWVERRALSIFVDPYSTRLSAGTVNYLISARFNGVVTNTAALNGMDDHA